MAYDFVGKKIATSMNGAKNSRIYTQTLLGQTIDENPVPEWTADPDNYPFVTFQNPRNGKVWGFSKRQLAYGLLVVGAPGSGKTTCFNGLVKPILKTLKAGEVMVIFDPKGDYLREFASYVPVNERIVIGVGASYKNITSYHNLFAEVMPRAINGRLVYTPESDDEAFELAIQLSKTMDSQIQPVFPAMAAQMFAAGMSYLMRTYWRSDPSKLNNRELVDFFQQKTVDDLRKIFEDDNMKDLKSCLDYIGNKGNQTQGVMSYLGAMIRKLFIGPFAQADPVREFSMRDIMNSGKRKVIFIEYDLRKGNLIAPMYGMLIDRALANALDGRSEYTGNKYILLDEALLLPRLEHLANSVNFGRSPSGTDVGVRMMCGLQNIAGIREVYGEAGADNVLSSFQNLISFKLCDYDTRQFVVNRLGNNYQNHSISAQQNNLNVQREGHTVEDWQLINLGIGEAIVSLQNEKPFFFQMPDYIR